MGSTTITPSNGNRSRLAALPALSVSAVLAYRGSDRAHLVWMGVLIYLVYTYAIYALQVRFNSLFLVYVALLGLSLYALIWGLATTNLAALRSRFTEQTPVRSVSVFLGTLAALFYLVWLGEVVPALLAGSVPPSVAQAGMPTSAVHVLDLAWILPAMALTALLLWRGRDLGYALAGALLAFVPLMTLAIGAMMVAMPFFGQPVALGMAGVFGAVAVVSAGMLVWYLRSIESAHLRHPDER